MVIDTIGFVLLMLNSNVETVMIDQGTASILLICTREEIEVEYILDCLYAELKVQSLPDVQDVLANSVLEFIWKIGDHSDQYTCRKKLQLFGALQS